MGLQLRVQLQARFPNLNGASLHRAFHVYRSIVPIWLKKCWNGWKLIHPLTNRNMFKRCRRTSNLLIRVYTGCPDIRNITESYSSLDILIIHSWNTEKLLQQLQSNNLKYINHFLYGQIKIFSCSVNTLYGPCQANLVLIAYASSEGSGEPAHPRSLARTFATSWYKQWVKRGLQAESQISGPSEWLGMHS